MRERATTAARRGARRAAAVIGIGMAAAAGPAARAQDDDALSGLIVDAASLPLDAAGQPQLDAVPGARQRQPLAADIEARLRELSAQRAAVGEQAPAGAEPARIAPLSGDGDAPARIDSGVRDPDRLQSIPPLPRQR